MRIEEAVEQMSKSYLHRIIDSFTRDLHKPELEESRDLIVRNIKELADEEHIATKLERDSVFHEHVLMKTLLEVLLAADDHRLTEAELIDQTQGREKDVIDRAKDDGALRYKDQAKLATYRTVLEVALEDDRISSDEMNLLIRLRDHLGLRERDHFLLQAQLGKFPTKENRPHAPSEITAALTDLQKRGVVLYCNRAEKEAFYVLPEEIGPGVKNALGIELSRSAFVLLLGRLTQQQLKSILDANKLPTSGKKEEQCQRVIDAGVKPSEALDVLGIAGLQELCKALPGVRSSGSKAEKTANIISHFANLRVVEVSEEADPREIFFQYYEELARRDRQNLLSNNVIGKDKHMDNAFEEATRYLFEQKLGLAHVGTPGSEHADGVLEFGHGDVLFMWDTKSKESDYTFPNAHLNQFKRYIRDSDRRVTCFLVIAPEIQPVALENALRLKAQSGTDTDVALIAAEDLKWIAEEWTDYAKTNRLFDLQVLNYTGILDRAMLQQRMRLFLS